VLAPVERLDGRLLQLRPLDRSLEFIQLDGPAAVEVEGLEDGTQVVCGHVLEAKLLHAGGELDGIDRAAAIGVDLMEEVDRTVSHMKDEAANFPDPNDRATQEEEFSLELRTRDRERKLIRKIDEALKRIEDRNYGYCLETGEEIGVKRLEARPVATLSLEAQERRERREKQYGDRDDRYR